MSPEEAPSLEQLYATFHSPPPGYGTIPWWIWNGRMEYGEIERQLGLMKEKGLDGWMLWVRFGIEIDYLSREFFERVRFAVQKSAELGLHVWIFDEYAWPSGSAHNEVVRAHPEFRMRVLSNFERRVAGGGTVRLEFPGLTDDPRVERVVAVRLDGEEIDLSTAHSITEFVVPPLRNGTPLRSVPDYEPGNGTPLRSVPDYEPGPGPDGPTTTARGAEWEIRSGLHVFRTTITLEWDAPAGEWLVLTLISRDFRAYIDAVNPAAVRQFIHCTHEQYKAWLGDYFGTTVKGFFLDEPRYLRHGPEKPQFAEPTVPWSADLWTRLVAAWNERIAETVPPEERFVPDLDQALVAVFHPTPPLRERGAALRVAFWQGLMALYREAYSQQLADWAEENNLLYGGDCFTEETEILVNIGDYFATAAPLHLPGLDSLLTPRIDDPTMRKGPKFPSSLAHHHGRPRCLAEGPGLLGWSATLEEMKWCTDWLYAYGVNLMVPNAFLYTIAHEHYYETPSYFHQWTLWPYYDVYDAYVRRLSWLLSQGHHVADVALFYPTATFLQGFNPRPTKVGHPGPFAGGSEELRFAERAATHIADLLLRQQIDFDYLDEQALAAATVEGGCLRLGNETYPLLLLPPTLLLSRAAFERLKEWGAGGGRLIAVGLLPWQLSDQPGATWEVDQFCRETFNVAPRECYEQTFHLADHFLSLSPMVHDRTAFLPLPLDFDAAELRRRLLPLLACYAEPHVEIAARPSREAFAHHLRRVGDQEVYFLANLSSEPQDAEIALRTTGRAEVWDPTTGSRAPLPGEVGSNRLRFTHAFAPHETLTIVTDRSQSPLPHSPTLPLSHSPTPPLPLPDAWDFEILDDNAYLPPSLIHTSEWLERRSWEGLATYRFAFPLEIAEVPERLVLLLDYVQTYWFLNRLRVLVNGEAVTIRPNESLDRELLEADLREAAREGTNEIVVAYDHTDYANVDLDLHHKRTAPPPTPKLRVLGRFKLLASGGRYVLHRTGVERVKTGSWTEFGYPFYSGTARYRQTFDLPENLAGRPLALCFEGLGEVARVTLNGRVAGVIPWRPWRLPVGDFLQPGRNVLELAVTNTQGNLMYEQPLPSGLLGAVWLTFL